MFKREREQERRIAQLESDVERLNDVVALNLSTLDKVIEKLYPVSEEKAVKKPRTATKVVRDKNGKFIN